MRRALWVITALFVFGSTARAEEPRGSVHLALEADILKFSRTKIDVEGQSSRAKHDLFHIGYPISAGARVGYVLLRNLELGAMLGFVHVSHSEDLTSGGTDEYTTGAYEFGGYGRFLLPVGEHARLFVGPFLGGNFLKQDDPYEDDEGSVTVTGRALTVGVDAGLYAFLADGFSVDPVLRFRYTTGSLKLESGAFSATRDAAGFEIGLGLALSGWIGPRK
jgi:hypothetical protein